MKDERKAYEEKFNTHLEELNARIVLLRTGADKAKAEAKVEYCKSIEVLQYKQDEGV